MEPGVLTTDDRGMKAGQNIYDDSDPVSIASLPPTNPHRDVDLEIIDADIQGEHFSSITHCPNELTVALQATSSLILFFLAPSSVLRLTPWSRLAHPIHTQSRFQL